MNLLANQIRAMAKEEKIEIHFNFYKEKKQREEAAVKIQKAWKRWLDLRVFDYFRELLRFQRCGQPSQLMKYIDPREAEFLDAAAGVHIRFRLGGIKFPPCIYYKIFTHRPVVDMCANSPKDYAKLATIKGRKGQSQGEDKMDTYGWYRRIENNGWRLLSSRFWKALDPLTVEDNFKVTEFHHNKLQKQQEVEKRRKRRKIEWLKKMYFGECLQVRTHDQNKTILIQRAAEGLISCLSNEGLNSVMEWEVDEILKWTTALNYEEYIKQWKALGVSRFSEEFQGFRFTEYYQPFKMTEIEEIIQKKAAKKKEPLQEMPSSVKYPSLSTSILCLPEHGFQNRK